VLGDGVAAAVAGFIRWVMSVFKLLSSVFTSLRRTSVASFCLLSAVGIASFRFCTSSRTRCASSSRRLLLDFSSVMTVSSSERAVSSLSVFCCSAALRASVSLAS